MKSVLWQQLTDKLIILIPAHPFRFVHLSFKQKVKIKTLSLTFLHPLPHFLSFCAGQATFQLSGWRCRSGAVGRTLVSPSPPSSRSWWCAESWRTTSATTTPNTTAWRVSGASLDLNLLHSLTVIVPMQTRVTCSQVERMFLITVKENNWNCASEVVLFFLKNVSVSQVRMSGLRRL